MNKENSNENSEKIERTLRTQKIEQTIGCLQKSGGYRVRCGEKWVHSWCWDQQKFCVGWDWCFHNLYFNF